MITIVVPTLDLDSSEKAMLAHDRAGIECDLIVVTDKEHEGYTKTVNRGLRLADGDVCILVDDCEVEEGWLRSLHDAVQARRGMNLGFVGPSGPCRTYPQASGRKGDGRRPKVVGHLAGFCLYVTAEALHELEQLDERFVHYASDVDLQWRGRQSGLLSLWVPGVYVSHELHPAHPEWWKVDHQMLKEKWRR